MKQNTKQANINIQLKDLFIKWLEITSSFHHLTKQEMRILSLLLYYHYQYRHEITNQKVLWKLVFDYDTKKSILKEVGITDAVYRNILTKLRKSKIIINNRIVDTFIPQLELNSKQFRIIFNFNIIRE